MSAPQRRENLRAAVALTTTALMGAALTWAGLTYVPGPPEPDLAPAGVRPPTAPRTAAPVPSQPGSEASRSATAPGGASTGELASAEELAYLEADSADEGAVDPKDPAAAAEGAPNDGAPATSSLGAGAPSFGAPSAAAVGLFGSAAPSSAEYASR